jgi:mono/diheme cytochrome c family protein
MLTGVLAGAGAAMAPGLPADDSGSAWDGVYSSDQATLGASVYPSVCGRCHGYRLDGAPDDPDMFSTQPIAGRKFLRNWNGRSLAALFEYTRTTMPDNNPGFLTDQEFVALVAYMLAMSGMPPGSVPLPTDPAVLAGITIEMNP